MTDSEKYEYWHSEYWDQLQKCHNDSEAKLEKYVFTISTGAVGMMLGLSGFLDSYKINFAITALGFFSAAMLLCVIYHMIAKGFHQKQFEMIKGLKMPTIDDTNLRQYINKTNKILDGIAIFSFVLICIGIVLFMVYLNLNKNI